MISRCVSWVSGFVLSFSFAAGSVHLSAAPAHADLVGGAVLNAESDQPPEAFVRKAEERKVTAAGYEVLSLSNPYGSIRITPSGSETVQVSAVYQVPASLEQNGNVFQLRSETMGKEMRIAIGFDQVQSLAVRQKIQKEFRGAVELNVLVPARMDLTLQTVDGAVELSQLVAQDRKIEVSSQRGAISFLSTKFRKYEVRCTACSLLMRNAVGNLNFLGGTGDVTLRQHESSRTFVSTTAGNIEVSGGKGEKSFTTRTGKVDIDDSPGEARVRTQSGEISASVSGVFTAQTESGKVLLTLQRNPADHSLDVETGTSPVHLKYAAGFSGSLDAETPGGKLVLPRHLESLPSAKTALSNLGHFESAVYGPLPKTLNAVQIGTGKPYCRVRSRSGAIEIAAE